MGSTALPTGVPAVTLVGPRGFGATYRARIASLVAQGRARLGAVVSPDDPAGLEDLPDGTPWFRTLEENLASGDPAARPDVVIVCTPIHTHLPIAEVALRAGCDVMLEKPPVPSAADHATLVRLVEETGRLCQVGFQTFGSTAVAEVVRIVASGEIGEVVSVGTVGTWTRPASYWARAPWAGRRLLDGVEVIDGVVTNPLAHAVATALRVGGVRRDADVAEVEVDLYRANPIEADDTSSVRVLATNGVTFGFGLSLCAPVRTPSRITVYGTLGRAVLYYETDRVEVQLPDGVRFVQGDRVPLLDDLLEVRERRAERELLCSVDATGAFTRVVEAVRTAPAPRPVPTALVRWVGEGGDRRPVVVDVEEWCERVAARSQTFTGAGAPWTLGG